MVFGVLVFAFLGCKKETELHIASNPIIYSFFVAGHTYGRSGTGALGVHPPFKKKFNIIQNDEFIDFGVFTGDIVRAGTKENWNEIDADIALIGRPVEFAVGNHDMSNRPLFEFRYGQTYKSFIHNSDLFIILDPNIDKWNISGNQLKFLKYVLNNNHQSVDNIFVFFHQLLWWEKDNIFQNVVLNSRQGRASTINFWSEIEPLFKSLPNKTYMFAGDVGSIYTGSEFMYHSYDNITFIASGMGGGKRDNFVITEVREDKTVAFRLISLNGNDIHSLGKLEDYLLP